jgi:hypothetical protein
LPPLFISNGITGVDEKCVCLLTSISSSSPDVQIARLYQPLDASLDADAESEDAQLLPLHSTNNHGTQGGKQGLVSGKGRIELGLGNVWDEREELFSIGENEDEEGGLDSRADGESEGEGEVPPKTFVAESHLVRFRE